MRRGQRKSSDGVSLTVIPWRPLILAMRLGQNEDPTEWSPWLFEAPNKIHCWFARLFDFHQMEWFFKIFFQYVSLNYSSYWVLAFSHSKRVGHPHLTLWHVNHVPEVTLLGDAAHPLLPYGSQGATQAGWNSEVKGFPAVDGSEIPKTHLGCIKTCK